LHYCLSRSTAIESTCTVYYTPRFAVARLFVQLEGLKS